MKTSQPEPLLQSGRPTGTQKLLCACRQVSEAEVRESIGFLKNPTVETVSYLTGAGTGCSACHCRIERLIEGKSACGPFGLCDGCGCCQAICNCTAEEAEQCQGARPCSNTN